MWCGKTAQGFVSQRLIYVYRRKHKITSGHGTAGISESGSG